MCLSSSEKARSYSTSYYYAFCLRRLSKRNNIRVVGLNRMRKVGKEGNYCKRKRSEISDINDDEIKKTVEMEMKNLKLYMENQSIIEENQKLRNKALLLHQENQALLSQLQLQHITIISKN